jgi:8-oxo-dGTP diphosphatase
MKDFIGVKIALIKDDEVLVILRDDKPGLRNANLWDFPGGGREDNETPFECVARETDEELSIKLAPESIIWEKTYPAMHDPNLTAYFMVAKIDDNDVTNIVFGDEGQGWKMIKIDDFMSDPTVIEQLKGRLNDYLASTKYKRT